MLPFVPSERYIESYVDFITQIIHDPHMPFVARSLREGLTDDEIVTKILADENLHKSY